MSKVALSLRQIADELHKDPRLAESFVQQTEHSQEYNTPVRKQGGDGFEKGTRRLSEFRVVLKTGDKKHFADVTKETLPEALHVAFEAADMAMPAALLAAIPKPAPRDVGDDSELVHTVRPGGTSLWLPADVARQLAVTRGAALTEAQFNGVAVRMLLQEREQAQAKREGKR